MQYMLSKSSTSRTTANIAQEPQITPMEETPPKRPSVSARQNSSQSQLSSSAQARPKAHLVGKKNRSSGQLTKLVKTHSGKNLAKLGASKAHGKFRKNVHGKLRLAEGSDGDDDIDGDEDAGAWIEDDTGNSAGKGHGSLKAPSMKRSITEPGRLTTMATMMQQSDVEPTMGNATDVIVDPKHTASARVQNPEDTTQASHIQFGLPNQQQNAPRTMQRNVSFAPKPEISQLPALSTASSANTLATQSNQVEDEHDMEKKVHNGRSYEEKITKREAIDTPSRSHAKFEGLRDEEDESDTSTDEDEDETDIPTPRKEREALTATTPDIEAPLDEPVSHQQQHLQETPMSRTQYRLNVERLHAMNFREPRQRPSDTYATPGVFGERRAREVDPLTGKVSIPRVCREARREVKVVRARCREPLVEAVENVLSDAALRRAPKPAQKKSAWSGKIAGTAPQQSAKAPAQGKTKLSPVWDYSARVRAVEDIAKHARRLWETPMSYSTE